MKIKKVYLFGAIIIITVLFTTSSMCDDRTINEMMHDDDYGEHLGTVNFPVSCGTKARTHTDRGLALLHNMTYEGARSEFAAATAVDPDCAMGYWGQAMTFIHPLWSDPPSETEFKKGQALLKEARTRGSKTKWESSYITAAEAYYNEDLERGEKVNLAAFEKGWEKVYLQFPKDMEAASFYSLAQLGTSSPADKTYAKQKSAGAIVEKVLARVPDHPGAHHYIIHAYDYPELADRALSVARNYAKIAPEVPHSLHMPTHILTRFGFWNESIALNKRSADAALKHPVNGRISLHYTHAVDYLVYAYLQLGEDRKAQEILNHLNALKGPYQIHIASAYTFAAVPARVALEQQKWAEAASLTPREPTDYPWERFPAVEAVTHFARALGAARNGNGKDAGRSIDQLERLRELTEKSSAYWAVQVEIMRLSAMAWQEYQNGSKKKALNIMQRAAGLEASTEKHPVTPGEILPARELLGDMLLDMGRYSEAIEAYRAALQRSPNRLNSLYGAGHSAELSGNKNEALSFYRTLSEMTSKNSERERLQEVRMFLSKN